MNTLKKLANNNHLLIAILNDEVLGYLTIDITTEKEFFKQKRVDITANNDPVLILNTCASKYEKCGIGSKLVNFAINQNFKNVKKIYCPAWKHSDVINIAKLLDTLGFNSLIELKNYWFEESLGIDKFCPACNTPCFCSLVIYCKIL